MTELQTAITHHRAGDLGRAAGLYLELIAADENNADAWHLLGLIAGEQGRAAEAVERIRRAIELSPGAGIYHANLGLALGKQNRWEEAIVSYRTALRLDPRNPQVLGKLGRALARTGQVEEAVEALRAAIEMADEDADLWNALGSALAMGHKPDEAAECFERTLRMDPLHDEAIANLKALGEQWARKGEAASTRQEWTEAAAAFEWAVRCAPEVALWHFNLGLSLTAVRRLAEARDAYSRALAIDPGHAESWNNFGHVALALDQTETALAAYRKALELRPDYLDARYNLGVALQGLGRTAEAGAAYKGALELRPEHADSWNNLGGIALTESGPHAAIPHYLAALQSNPGHIDARWNLGLAQLSLGNFREGWEGYEARLERQSYTTRGFPYPRWNGEDLSGRRVHVWAEQGLGDTIQFARYLPLIEAAGGRAVFECPARLRPLLESAPGIELLRDGGAGGTTLDYHAPLLSLPKIFGTEFGTIPDPGPGYTVPAGVRERWRRLLGRASGLRAGIVWAANAANQGGQNRSMLLSDLQPLSKIEGLEWFSLQRGPQAGEARELAWLRAMEAEDGTILDTAAAMLEMDLVISVDTMTAHLAATLGRPTWILLPHPADWRWMTERDDSPWYPMARLFRQPRAGDWASAVGAAVAAIGEMLRLRAQS